MVLGFDGGDEATLDVHSRCREFCCLELKAQAKQPDKAQMRSLYD
jgi:hypothetical protein